MQGLPTKKDKAKMTRNKFTYLSVLVIACLSFALAQQGGNVAEEHDKSRVMGVEVGKNALRVNKIMGRKMVTRLEPMESYHATGSISMMSKRTDEASFENSNNKGGKKALHVGRKFKVNPLPDKEVDDRGFVAFNADYHAPRHHPPKHN